MFRPTIARRRTAVGGAAIVLALTIVALPKGQAAPPAQAPPPLAPLLTQVHDMYTPLKTNFTKAADMFPEGKYNWSPTPEVRTWSQLFLHVVDDNYIFCTPITGDPKPPTYDDEGKPTDAAKNLKKADVVKMLADSFAVCDHAFTLVSADNMNDRITPISRRSKIGALMYSVQHISEHYGNAVTYMRLNGLVPPSSQPAPGRGRGSAF
jgi:uncharacterized damage-inducible protein DinB